MPSRPIVLDLASPGAVPAPDPRVGALAGVVEDLVALLEAQFPDNVDFPADALKMRLQHARERLRSAERAEEIPPAGLRLVGDASQAYARLSGHTAAREGEFCGVIRLLRALVDGLRGDAQAFRQDLLCSSERVAELTQIEDIRTLRRALSREVDQLRHCVQQGERQESTRWAQVAGDLKKADAAIAAQAAEDHERASGLLTRAVLLGDLASAPLAPAAIVLCRVDDPDTIIDSHGAPVLDRVIIALAQLLRATFGKALRVYRPDTQCVAMFLPLLPTRRTAQLIKQVQSRVAPEYEYERHGVTRRVVFTFSSVITSSAGRSPLDAAEALARAESQVTALEGLSQLQAETTGLGRLVGWLS